MKTRYIYITIICLALVFNCNAQSITLTPKGNISSQFNLATTSDISQTGSPTISQLIYNTNINITGTNANGAGYYFWNGTNWQSLDANIPQNTIVFSETHPNQSLINAGFSMIGTTQVTTPALDVWRNIDTTNIPIKNPAYFLQSNDSKIYIWGEYGTNGIMNRNGGIYNPITDSWTAIDTINSPININGRYIPFKDRILFEENSLTPDITKSRIFNPYLNNWTPLSINNASTLQRNITSKDSNYAFEWNGQSGKVLNIITNSWSDISLINAPVNATISENDIFRINLGTKLFIWYGGNDFNEGFIYDALTSQWTTISNINKPDKVAQSDWYFSRVQTQNDIMLRKTFGSNTLFKMYDIIQNSWLDMATLQNFTSNFNYLGNYTEKFFFINYNDFKIIEFNKNSNQWRIIPNSKYQEYETSQHVYFCGGKIIKYEATDYDKGYTCDGFVYDILTENWSYLPPVFGRNVWGNNFCNNEYFISLFGRGLPRRDNFTSKISGIVQLSGTTNQTTPKTLYLYRKN